LIVFKTENLQSRNTCHQRIGTLDQNLAISVLCVLDEWYSIYTVLGEFWSILLEEVSGNPCLSNAQLVGAVDVSSKTKVIQLVASRMLKDAE